MITYLKVKKNIQDDIFVDRVVLLLFVYKIVADVVYSSCKNIIRKELIS
jgi:hypothetical protein